MSRGVVVSRTIYGKGICYSLLDLDSGKEVRPCWERSGDPYNFIHGSFRGMVFHNSIHPGEIFEYHVSSNPNFTPRITHPEDTLIKPPYTHEGKMDARELKYLIAKYTHQNLLVLFPFLKQDEDWVRWYTPADAANPHSTGFLRTRNASIKVMNSTGGPKFRVFVETLDSQRIDTPLIDEAFSLRYARNPKAVQTEFNNPTIRLSLSQAYKHKGESGSRCYLQCSMILQ